MKHPTTILDQERQKRRIQDHLEKGANLVKELAEWLNNEIRKTGQLQRNNHALWEEFLHKWDNREWAQVLGYLEALNEACPELFKSYHEQSVFNATTTLGKHWESEHDRVLDKKPHKKTAWSAIMTVREVYNAANGIDLPNEDSSKDKGNNLPPIFDIE